MLVQWNAATGGISEALLSCRPLQSNLAIQFEAVSIAKSSGPRRHGDSGRTNRQKVRFV